MKQFKTCEEAEVFAQELTAQFPGIKFKAGCLDQEQYPGTSAAWVGLFDHDGSRCVSTVDSREAFDQLLSVAQKLTQAIADNQQSEEVRLMEMGTPIHLKTPGTFEQGHSFKDQNGLTVQQGGIYGVDEQGNLYDIEPLNHPRASEY